MKSYAIPQSQISKSVVNLKTALEYLPISTNILVGMDKEELKSFLIINLN